MRGKKALGAVLCAGNAALLGLYLLLSGGKDREAPEIEFETVDTVYEEGIKEEELLKGVKAHDGKDGDLTERVAVEKITRDPEEGKAVVFYAVSDRAGNAARAAREFPALLEEEGKEKARELEEAGAEELLKEPVSEESPEGEPVPSPAESPSPSPSPSPAESPSPAPTERPTPVPTERPEEPSQAQAPAEEPEPAEAGGGAPVLVLKTGEVKTRRGVRPAWVNLIETLKDDKDSYETLFYNIRTSRYDINQTGTYAVTVVTEDSEGNESAAVPLTIIVE